MKHSLLPKFDAAKPNAAHLFFGNLHKQGKLHGIVTQNIDSLHHEGLLNANANANAGGGGGEDEQVVGASRFVGWVPVLLVYACIVSSFEAIVQRVRRRSWSNKQQQHEPKVK